MSFEHCDELPQALQRHDHARRPTGGADRPGTCVCSTLRLTRSSFFVMGVGVGVGLLLYRSNSAAAPTVTSSVIVWMPATLDQAGPAHRITPLTRRSTS